MHGRQAKDQKKKKKIWTIHWPSPNKAAGGDIYKHVIRPYSGGRRRLGNKYIKAA